MKLISMNNALGIENLRSRFYLKVRKNFDEFRVYAGMNEEHASLILEQLVEMNDYEQRKIAEYSEYPHFWDHFLETGFG